MEAILFPESIVFEERLIIIDGKLFNLLVPVNIFTGEEVDVTGYSYRKNDKSI